MVGTAIGPSTGGKCMPFFGSHPDTRGLTFTRRSHSLVTFRYTHEPSVPAVCTPVSSSADGISGEEIALNVTVDVRFPSGTTTQANVARLMVGSNVVSMDSFAFSETRVGFFGAQRARGARPPGRLGGYWCPLRLPPRSPVGRHPSGDD